MQIKIEDLKKDMRFSKDVFFDDGQCLLLAAGNAIGERELNALKQWEIPYVVTDGKVLDGDEEVEVEALEIIDDDLGEVEDITNTIYIEGSQLSDENIALVSKMVVFDIPQELKNAPIYAEYTELLKDVSLSLSLIKENKTPQKETFQEHTSKIVDMTMKASQEVMMFILAGGAKPDETLKNVVNEALLTSLLCLTLDVSDEGILSIVTASLLHRAGALRLPAVLPSEGQPFSDVEIQVLTTQLSHAYKCAVHELGYPEHIGKIIRQQYECWDGSGQPESVAGDNIEIGARIIAVADEFVMLISKKEQKKTIMSHEAIKHLLQDNSHKFDPNVVKAIVQCLGIYPIGSIVLLNDGSICKVVGVSSDAPLRPIVQVLLSEKGKIQSEAQSVAIDLKTQKDKFIVRTVDPRVYLQ